MKQGDAMQTDYLLVGEIFVVKNPVDRLLYLLCGCLLNSRQSCSEAEWRFSRRCVQGNGGGNGGRCDKKHFVFSRDSTAGHFAYSTPMGVSGKAKRRISNGY